MAKLRTWVAIISWLLTLGALIPFIVIQTAYVTKYDVPHMEDPSENDLVLDVMNPNAVIIMDVTFTSLSIDCALSMPTTYQKCTTDQNGGKENCKDMDMCTTAISNSDISGSMGLAWEGSCSKCSNDMASQRMAYSTGEARTRDDAACFFGSETEFAFTYLFCVPPFEDIYNEYAGWASLLLVASIVLGIFAIISTIYVVYKNKKDGLNTTDAKDANTANDTAAQV
eukprot:665290_1